MYAHVPWDHNLEATFVFQSKSPALSISWTKAEAFIALLCNSISISDMVCERAAIACSTDTLWWRWTSLEGRGKKEWRAVVVVCEKKKKKEERKEEEEEEEEEEEGLCLCVCVWGVFLRLFI